jgi:DNA invertase Pin-like site-specific DNA recombinase
MWQMVGLMAEFEHSLISERTKAGIVAARARGVKFGRKRKLTAKQIDLVRKLIERGEDRGAVAESFKVNRTTLYRALAYSAQMRQ